MQPFTLEDGTVVQPRRSLVAVRPAELLDNYKSEGGLVLPGGVKQWIPPQQGEVIAFGAGVSKVKVGDVVVYGLGCGKTFHLGDGLVLLLTEGEIIGKVAVN